MKKLGAIILVLGLMTMGLVFLPNAAAPPWSIDLSVGKYSGLIANYVPTEEIKITIGGPDSEIYDISIRDSGSIEKKLWNDKSPTEDDELELTYEIPSSAPDGWYDIYVCDSTAVTCDWPSALIWDGYWVQLWTINIETDRGQTGSYQDWNFGGEIGDGSYLPDEVVTVHYSITMRKDNMPVQTDDGYLDWVALDNTGAKIDGEQDDRVEGIGMFTFELSGSADPSDNWWDDYQVRAWYNESTGVTPDNVAMDLEYFYVGSLGVDVYLPFGSTYAPGDHVMADVTLFADMGDPSNGIWDWDEHEVIPGTPLDPGVDPAEVDINIFEWDGTDWDAQTQYDVEALIPDYHGIASYIFTLDSGIADGTDFKVEGTGKYVGLEITSSTTFTVTITGVLRVDIELDKLSYTSGETITASATVQTSGTAATEVVYAFQVFEVASGGALILLDEQIGTENTFEYTTTEDFEGTLRFQVTAKNVDGFEHYDWITTSVSMGDLLVNADREEYNAGDTIQVSYELVGPLSNPTYYYTVTDAIGVIIESGEPTGGNFDFKVPSIPSNWYTFRVYANVDGRTLQGSDNVQLVQGYFLSISFDREIYSLGDTMTIKYTITARGDSKLPASFTFQYGLSGGPGADFQAANTQATVASGEFTYKIPSSAMDEGTLIFTVYEFTTGSSAQEVITVRGGNPLWWAKLAEIPAFDILLLILIIILFILLLKMRSGRAPAAAAGAPMEEAPPATPGEEPPPPSEPGMEAAAGASALSVPCKSCGSPIELTTSKRPIEVMCPSCGETQMAY